jgi:hypothetical protein
MTIELASRIVRAEDAASAEVDAEIVLLPSSLDEYLALDEVGRRIWELLESPHLVGELCRKLSEEFDATEEQIGADVLPFLDELADKGLVRVVEE